MSMKILAKIANKLVKSKSGLAKNIEPFKAIQLRVMHIHLKDILHKPTGLE